MHGYYWGYRGIPRTGAFSWLNYSDSPLGLYLMIGFMALVTLAVVLLIVSTRKRHRQIFEETEAMVIIKRRYAKGELTIEDFQRMKKDLQ
ncbi:MAG: SHOCT domain-containing protein [Sphaerochaeta sp.]|nr:SHOCT domain-containing protein [Sphaerochaeta sp.]